MEQTYIKTRICKLCEKTITYKIRTDDGYDWCGHQRGSSSYEEIDNKCNCTEYLKNPYERYCNWEWSSKDPNEIIIVYGFWNYNDEWDYDKYHITIEELSNFKPND